MAEKRKIKFNPIDCIILLVIIAAVAFVAYKVVGQKAMTNADGTKYEIIYYFEEVPDYAADIIKKGDPILDEAKNIPLGKITDVKTGEAAVYSPDSNGMIQKSAKEDYKSVTLTTEVNASDYEYGVEISGAKYGVGHTFTVRAGKSKLYGKVKAIEKK